MALPGSGNSLSISQIKAELNSSSNSLHDLSVLAGFSTPDAISEFYGYSAAPTLTPFDMAIMGSPDSNNACQEGPTFPTETFYADADPIAVNTGIYIQPDNTFNGGNMWYWYPAAQWALLISDGGKVDAIVVC